MVKKKRATLPPLPEHKGITEAEEEIEAALPPLPEHETEEEEDEEEPETLPEPGKETEQELPGREQAVGLADTEADAYLQERDTIMAEINVFVDRLTRPSSISRADLRDDMKQISILLRKVFIFTA